MITNMNSIQSGTLIDGRYEVRELLGQGGMGTVYLVYDKELDTVLALKILHPHLLQNESMMARFSKEAKVARSLNHPNIVRIHDIGLNPRGFTYITMEYIDGYSLREQLNFRAESMASATSTGISRVNSMEEAIDTMIQVLKGISYAHEQGIVHRDMKPDNVMISRQGDVKIADFGTARILGEENRITQTGQLIGTPDYISPEQVAGNLVDQRTDIYSLGIMAYELVVGTVPFESETFLEAAVKHLNDPIPEFAAEEFGIPIWYQEMVIKAAAKTKEERFQTAREFHDILIHYSGRDGSGVVSAFRLAAQEEVDEDYVEETFSEVDEEKEEQKREIAKNILWVLFVCALLIVSYKLYKRQSESRYWEEKNKSEKEKVEGEVNDAAENKQTEIKEYNSGDVENEKVKKTTDRIKNIEPKIEPKKSDKKEAEEVKKIIPTLPINAQANEESTANFAVVEQDPENHIQNISNKYVYTGELKFDNEELHKSKAIRLTLTLTAGLFTGSAKISDLGTFNVVSGADAPLGMTITLKGGAGVIRMFVGEKIKDPNGNMARIVGKFLISTEEKSGTFDLKTKFMDKN